MDFFVIMRFEFHLVFEKFYLLADVLYLLGLQKCFTADVIEDFFPVFSLLFNLIFNCDYFFVISVRLIIQVAKLIQLHILNIKTNTKLVVKKSQSGESLYCSLNAVQSSLFDVDLLSFLEFEIVEPLDDAISISTRFIEADPIFPISVIFIILDDENNFIFFELALVNNVINLGSTNNV